MRSAVVALCILALALCMTPHVQALSFKEGLLNMVWKNRPSHAAEDSVPIPYSNCGSSSDHLNISSVTSTTWPPQKGATFVFNLTGTLDEQVTSGTYTLQVTYFGITIINQNGDLSSFVKLPAGPGPVVISDGEEIPSSAPAGPYVVTFTAVDQSKEEIVCLDIKFTMSEEGQAVPLRPQKPEGHIPIFSHLRRNNDK